MRLATFQHQGRERFGLVLRHPRDSTDWIFDPAAVETAARNLPALKGAGYTWWRPDFCLEGGWPVTLVEVLKIGTPALEALRRMQDFLLGFPGHGDAAVFARSGWPVAAVELQAPIPEPPLLLGVVGNNAGFLRMDTTRARNLQQPSCHQRTQTSIIGPGQPFVLPGPNIVWAGTAELGVIIGRGGRDIPRERAREHIAGYTVINDAITFAPTDRTLAAERASRPGKEPRLSFHAANTASWLGKKADTMLAMGPWLVTPDEVGDPYDLISFYREGGSIRNRAHSGAICCGIEETIHWLSRFIELTPGMVLHLGAMGQDGIPALAEENFGPAHRVEAEIERVGVLQNPLVVPAVRDWRSASDPSLSVHAVPLVRKLIASRQTQWDASVAWTPAHARHFWTATTDAHATPPSQPFFYNHPATALSRSGGTVRLPGGARTITAGGELAFVVGRMARNLRPEDVAAHLLGAIALLGFRDSSFADQLVAPHLLSANMPEIYARWPDGFNVVSTIAPFDPTLGARRITVSFGTETRTASTAVYNLDIASAIAELSTFVTLLPGDVICLGPVGDALTLPSAKNLPADAQFVVIIEGIGEARAFLNDQRHVTQ